MPDELALHRCEKCDYMSLSVPLNEKKTFCPWDTRLACDVFLTSERLKDRINYLSGKRGALFIDGVDKCVDTFMQQMPASADSKDLKKRIELIRQTSLF